MRKLFIGAFACAILSLVGCQKDSALVVEDGVPDSVISQLKGMGFGTDNVQRTEGGYLVEGDMIITPEMLSGNHHHQKLRIAEVEQYRTFNLVTGLPRNITVGTSGSIPTALSNSINNAINRYNLENLGITFTRVSGSGNITIKIVNTNQYIASAGFPSNGNPYPTVNYAKRYSTYSDGFMTTVLAHEIGHCIGFRHTDYMNRAYSCGSGGNEGQETTGVGAVNIPGTPTGPDAASWMLACLGASTNRPFNTNDKLALAHVY